MAFGKVEGSAFITLGVVEDEPPSSVVSVICGGLVVGETVGEVILVRDDLIILLSDGLVVLDVTNVTGLGCNPSEEDDD